MTPNDPNDPCWIAAEQEVYGLLGEDPPAPPHPDHLDLWRLAHTSTAAAEALAVAQAIAAAEWVLDPTVVVVDPEWLSRPGTVK